MGISAARRDTEEAFLDAAERLLIQLGYAQITTRKLAEAAGANHGLVHYYFGSMEELFVRVLERFTARITERQRAMYGSDIPFIEKWRRAMAYIDEDLASGYPKVWMELEAMAWNSPEFCERLIAVHDEWHTLLSDAISRAVDEYGLDRATFPLRGMTALVKTFNLGILLERLIGARNHHEALLSMIDDYLQSLEKRKR
ncbi:MAG: TetR/AcrR family transcriptional regulator [Candidatus Velthaea sp.]